MKSVYTEKVPKEMMQSSIDRDGWYEWKLIPGTLTTDDYKKVEAKFKATFPDNFIEWHKRYFFEDGDCSIIRLPNSLPTKPLEKLIDNLDWYIPEQLIPLGLIPFADEGNDAGPLVFDTRNTTDKKDFPIRVYDHEFGGENQLSEQQPAGAVPDCLSRPGEREGEQNFDFLAHCHRADWLPGKRRN